MSAPLYDALMGMKGRVSFHMPGHKGMAERFGMHLHMDVTELDLSDNLYHPEGPIVEAQALAARSAGAAHTILLTNGSTCGMHAMLCYSARPGQKVILPRATHMSAVSACALYGLEPVWVQAHADDGGAPVTREQDVLDAIRDNPDARCVLITRPDYYGRLMPMERIARAAHAAGMLMLVDEAHGAHLNWLDARTGVWTADGTAPDADRVNAMRMGADMCMQSAHKTLDALTGSAFLHAAAGVDADRLLRCVALTQSTSPSFLMMASLDSARDHMDRQGGQELDSLCGMCEQLYEDCAAMGGFMPAREYFGVPCDRTRVTLDVTGRGLSGFEALRLLGDMGVDIEMADLRRIVMIGSAADTQQSFDRLREALKALPVRKGSFIQPGFERLVCGRRVMGVREAALGDSERVPLAAAAGRIAARAVGMYPPGVPACVPGEEITREVLERLERAQGMGASLFGLERGMCVVLKR